MLGKFFECEADKKINFNAEQQIDMGGFCVSTFDYIFRWLIRGDTLCEVIIPENEKIYKTVSENGIYIAEKIILTNPKKIDDDFATELYLKSNLPEVSYFKAMTACAICSYIKTALKVCEDKVNKDNVDTAIIELEEFCKRRSDEKFIEDMSAISSVQILKNKLLDIKSNKDK